MAKRKIDLKDDGLAMGLSILSGSASCGLLAGAVHSFNEGNEVVAALQAGGFLFSQVWAWQLVAARQARGPGLGQIMVSASEPVRVNGRQVFLNAMPWFGPKKPEPPATPVFLVPYRNLQNRVRVAPARVESYALLGWRRQQAGDPQPFSRRKFMEENNWSEKWASCCYKVLGYSGCFDSFGQGAHSKLVVSPHRVRHACLVRFSPTLAHHLRA